MPIGINYISNFNLLDHLFGVGNAQFYQTENDLVDIYGKFGIIILFLIILFLLKSFIKNMISGAAQAKCRGRRGSTRGCAICSALSR